MSGVKIEPIFAIITDAPTAPAPARSHIYHGDIMFPSGRVENARIGPNVGAVWDPPLFVRPMPVSTPNRPSVIPGALVNEQDILWFGQETAHFGSCSGSGASGVSVSPLVRMWQQASAPERKWLAQQFMEAMK